MGMLQEDYMGQAARRIDDREARAVERSIFGPQKGHRGKDASLERKPVLGTPLDLSVIDAYFASKESQSAATAVTPDAAPRAAKASDAEYAAPTETTASETPAADGDGGVPEADRLFAPPTADEAAHVLRDLTWGEHFVGTRMASSRGNTPTYLFSFEQAATFFLEGSAGGASLSSSGSFAWVDFEKFSDWMRVVVGDTPFADALDEQLADRDAYNDRIETLRRLLALRWAQYEPFTHPAGQGLSAEHGERGHVSDGALEAPDEGA